MTDHASFFHGGQRGLLLGRRVLPPSITRARHTLQEAAICAGLQLPARHDRVYVTPSLEVAIFYAALHPSRGWAYRVVPEGELEPDPDCLEEGLSFQVPRARIVQVIKPSAAEVRAVVSAMVADGR